MKGGVDEEDMGVQLCILSVVVPVCSQPAQAVAGKETFAGVKAAGTCVSDGRFDYEKWGQSTVLANIRERWYLTLFYSVIDERSSK